MRSVARHAWLSLAIPLLLGCQPRPQFTAQDEAQVRAVFDSALAYIKKGDWASWSALFSEDAFLQPPNGATVSGRARLRTWGEAFPPIESATWPNVQVWGGDGNIAYGTSAWTLKLRGLPADSGKQLAVLRRNANNKWEVVAVSFNSDFPIPSSAVAPRRSSN
jgi:ketosteroid isomerase-like protein